MAKSAGKKAVALAVAGAAAGVSGLVLGAGPAYAGPGVCGADGTLITGNVCEQTFTATGAATFTPTADMGKLQVLLVAGGGSGVNFISGPNYGPNGGGGGEVKVVDYTGDHTVPLDLVVGGTGGNSTVTKGATTITATGGGDGEFVGGSSGNGNSGSTADGPDGGGGAGASPTAQENGGAGAIVADIAPAGSLFSDDTNCYGGGGAVGTHGGTIGTATCGGGSVTDGATVTDVVAPTANSGGGGGGGDEATDDPDNTQGATGLIVVRWQPTVTVTFAANGHGTTTTEVVDYGSAPTEPTTPTATGFVFKGWYTDPSLTTPASFTAPVTASETFYASWGPALATTGGGFSPLELPLGLGALAAGLGLASAATVRRVRKTARQTA